MAIRGVEYCVNEWGSSDAPLFFYLHGWADTGSTFQFVIDALASDWRVIAPDWRGFGRSTDDSAAYWFPDYLADLHEILNHFSPEQPVRLVGHSMGANVCSLYGGTMPERVAAIVNIEGFGLTDSNPEDAPNRYREWLEAGTTQPEFSKYADMQSLASKLQKRSPALSDSQAEFVAREWARENGDTVRLRANPNHKLPNPVLYRRTEAEACWRNIGAAVLLISGELSPFARQFGSTADLPFPSSESSTIPAVGHMIHFEAPEALAAQIDRFLTKYL
jgi:pimeloyl-ACP methyl ester carboxylesterase